MYRYRLYISEPRNRNDDIAMGFMQRAPKHVQDAVDLARIPANPSNPTPALHDLRANIVALKSPAETLHILQSWSSGGTGSGQQQSELDRVRAERRAALLSGALAAPKAAEAPAAPQPQRRPQQDHAPVGMISDKVRTRDMVTAETAVPPVSKPDGFHDGLTPAGAMGSAGGRMGFGPIGGGLGTSIHDTFLGNATADGIVSERTDPRMLEAMKAKSNQNLSELFGSSGKGAAQRGGGYMATSSATSTLPQESDRSAETLTPQQIEAARAASEERIHRVQRGETIIEQVPDEPVDPKTIGKVAYVPSHTGPRFGMETGRAAAAAKALLFA